PTRRSSDLGICVLSFYLTKLTLSTNSVTAASEISSNGLGYTPIPITSTTTATNTTHSVPLMSAKPVVWAFTSPNITFWYIRSKYTAARIMVSPPNTAYQIPY